MFILLLTYFLSRPFRLENTPKCYNLRGGQGGSTEVIKQLFLLYCWSTGSSPRLRMNRLKILASLREISDEINELPVEQNRNIELQRLNTF